VSWSSPLTDPQSIWSRTNHDQLKCTDELAIFSENFYTPPLAGEITHVQCAKKTPEKDAQA
jgi:hypothetical protein